MRSKNVGIWIDHKEAVLVFTEEAGVPRVERIKSYAGGHFHPTGGWKAGGTSVAQSVSDERSVEERRKRHFHNFYQMVIEKVGRADSVFLFGPGEARTELVKEMEAVKGRHFRIAATEAADRLTENQIVAKVKSFFERDESPQTHVSTAAG